MSGKDSKSSTHFDICVKKSEELEESIFLRSLKEISGLKV